jgi:hypothetical protein
MTLLTVSVPDKRMGGTLAGSKLFTPPFVVALVLLGTAVILAGPVTRWMAIKQIKKALPLKAPLSRLDAAAIAPYRLREPHVLESEFIEALGTDQYLSWTIENPEAAPDDPLRFAHLFVTYYSGGADLVPHVPDICYLGAGYDPARPHETAEMDVRSWGAKSAALPLKVCTFAKSALFDRREITVVYTFACNGRFAADAHQVRIILSDLTTTYAFFSKVEASFFAGTVIDGKARPVRWASREESVGGVRRLFERLLPVLVRDHWPDFEAAEREAS